ncbi:MAG: hypothetical protein WBC85_12385, partial [Planktotalea sp.]|uniref:hypothetical protein n=1 Tax=Planktotalea sp. TaxID=2029877 RepID=UPI003C71D04E
GRCWFGGSLCAVRQYKKGAKRECGDADAGMIWHARTPYEPILAKVLKMDVTGKLYGHACRAPPCPTA